MFGISSLETEAIFYLKIISTPPTCGLIFVDPLLRVLVGLMLGASSIFLKCLKCLCAFFVFVLGVREGDP